MEFAELLHIVADEPVFESSLLFAGVRDIAATQLQLARWTAAGWLIQLRRGLYTLAPPYRKREPHPFVIANRMAQPSYVGGESALAFHGLIPEYVPTTTSVTVRKPARWHNAYGTFDFRHIKTPLFFGYTFITVDAHSSQGQAQQAFIALPEKALLDIIYLRAGGDSVDFIQSLRLQHTEQLNLDRLLAFAERSQSAKLRRGAAIVRDVALDLQTNPADRMEMLS